MVRRLPPLTGVLFSLTPSGGLTEMVGTVFFSGQGSRHGWPSENGFHEG